jgi:glycerophosphoryl diester phosphodiesterase
MAAFLRAVQDGAVMVELDVRLSADEELVVMHDRRVNRTTGKRGRVRDLTVAELKLLDAGSWFGPSYSGERIPLLREVFRSLPFGIGLNIEAKTDGDRHRDGEMSRALGELITKEARGRELLVSSFDHHFLRRFHRMYPSVALGVLYMAVRDFARSPVALAHNVGAGTFVCSCAQLRKRTVADAHRNGLQCFSYGVNRIPQLRRVARFGIDGIITDVPARLHRGLHQR